MEDILKQVARQNISAASLDAGGKVPSGELPSYVDDVIEVVNFAALPGTGEGGKIYVTLDNNKTYRWGGSVYIETSPNDVNSVNGQTGIVSLASGDIPESSNLYYTETRVSANADVSGNTLKLAGIESGATADQTKADIEALGINIIGGTF